MFKKEHNVGLLSIIITAFLLCAGLIIGGEAAVNLCTSGEGGIKLFFGILFLLIGARRAFKLF